MEMKLQKQVSRRTSDKEYSKYVVVIPPDQVQELGWKEGQDLDGEILGKKFVISAKPKRE